MAGVFRDPRRLHEPHGVVVEIVADEHLADDLLILEDRRPVEHLLDLAFGSGRNGKTSYRLREGNSAVPGLSMVTRDAGVGVSGTISFWPLAIGVRLSPALLLGPLAVHPDRQGLGIGIALMEEGLARARAQGHGLVLLVGDEP